MLLTLVRIVSITLALVVLTAILHRAWEDHDKQCDRIQLVLTRGAFQMKATGYVASDGRWAVKDRHFPCWSLDARCSP